MIFLKDRLNIFFGSIKNFFADGKNLRKFNARRIKYLLCIAQKYITITASCHPRAVEHAHASSPRLSSRLSDTEKNRRPIGEELTGARPNCVRIAVGYSDDYTSNPLVELAVAPFAGKPIDRSRRVLSLSFSFSISLYQGETPSGTKRDRETRSLSSRRIGVLRPNATRETKIMAS